MLNKIILILSISFTTSLTLAHSLEGAWQVQTKTCYSNGTEAPCQVSPVSKIEISLPTENSIQKFCVKRIDSAGSTMECVNSYNYSGNGATSYADLWVQKDSINWRSIQKDSITNEIERLDLVAEKENSATFTEYRYTNDPNDGTVSDKQIEYKLVK